MSGKEMESRQGSIEIIDANKEEPTVGARSNKIYADFDMKGKPIVVEDLTSCDGRDDTVEYLGSKRSGFSSGLSPEIGRMLRSPNENEKAVDDDDDDPPSEVQWATRFTGKKVDITSKSAAVRIAPPSEVKRDKIKEGFTFHNTADRPFKTEELLAKLGIDQKAQANRQINPGAVVHIDDTPHRKVEDSTGATARALHRKTVLENRKAVLEKSLLRRYNAALTTSQGSVCQDVDQVGSDTPISRKSRETSSGRTGLHAVSSDDDRSQKAVRAKPGRKLGREEAKRGNDLTARSDIIHIADDEVSTDLVSNSSNTVNRMEDANEVHNRDIDLAKSSSSRMNRAEGPDQTSSKAVNPVKSCSSLSSRMEALGQVHIGIKTNTQKRVLVDDKDVDTGTDNAIFGEPDKKIKHGGTSNYAFDADESEISMQDEEKKESRSIDIIHVDSRDDENISTRALGNGEYDSDDNSESAVKSEAMSVDRHAEIERSRWDAPGAKESSQEKPTAEESYKDSPLVEENNYSTAEVDEYDRDTSDLVGNSEGNNPATRFELVGNDQEERAEQENAESDDEPELVHLMERKKGTKVIDLPQSNERAAHGSSQHVTANGIDSGMEHNAIQFVYPAEDLKETVQDNFELSPANTRKQPGRLGFHRNSRDVVDNEINIDGGVEHHAPQLVYPEKDDLESIIAQGSFEFVNANTKKLFRSGLGVHDSENVVESNINDGGRALKAKEDRRKKMEQDDSDSESGFMTANTLQKTVQVDYNYFTCVVGNSTNADGDMERFSQLVDVVIDDDDDKSIAGPSAINTYNRDLAISDETNSESCDLNDGREDVVLETSTPKATNKSRKEATGVDQGNFQDSENATGGDNGNFYHFEDDNTAESGSKISMEESMESDLDSDVYESFAVPFVVEMLDRSCAWFEERNNAMPCSRREPSLRDKSKEWTPPAKKSTFTSRKSTIANKKNDIPNKEHTLSPSEQAAKTFDTTAIKPQNPQEPEIITSAENATNKALASGLQPIEQDSATEKSSKDVRPLRRSAKNQKKKTSKRRSTKAQGESDEQDSNHFHEKLRHLWTMKRQAQKYKQTHDLNEHSEDSERQSSAENSTASSAKNFSPRFIARSMTAPTETNPTRPDESCVRRPAEHPTNVLAARSLAAEIVETTEAPAMPSVSPHVFTEAVSTRYLASRSASPKAFAETEDSVARSIVLGALAVSQYDYSETEAVPARYLATRSASPNAFAKTEDPTARSIAPEAFAASPYGFSETESAPARYIRRRVAQPSEAPAASSLPAEASVVTKAPAMPSVSGYVYDETENAPAHYVGTRSSSKAFSKASASAARSIAPAAFARVEALSVSFVAPKAFTDRSVEESPSEPAYPKRALQLPEASDLHRPEHEPPVLRTTRVIRLAGGPESMFKPSRSTRRREHAEALSVLEREENNDSLQIAAAEEAIAEAFTIGYDTLDETERLDAIELAERLQRRASALKRRRKQRQKKLLDLHDMQDMDDSNGTDEEPNFI